MDTTLNILIIIDYYGWAFENNALGIQKYSKHHCTIKSKSEVSEQDFYSSDLILSMISFKKAILGKDPRSYRNAKKITAFSSVRALGETCKCDRYLATSDEIYELAIKKYPRDRLSLVRFGVDTEIFYPYNQDEKKHQGFMVSWAGNYPRKEKRTYLLSKLKYPVRIKSDRIFEKNNSRKSMVDFYNSTDVMIQVSYSEGFGLVPLEAMACGLPVVATRTGIVPKLLEERWIIPVYPENIVIELMNERLTALEKDPVLRKEVGKRNYEKILNEWNWKIIAKDWDKLFKEIYEC